NQPELAGFLAELRALVDERPGRMTVGELFDGTATDAASLVEPRHLVFDWATMFVPWDATAFRNAVTAREAVFGPDRWPANALSNHDQPRHASRFDLPGTGVDGEGDARAKVAAAILLTLRGTPFLYYGEEIGKRNISVPRDRAADPFALHAEPGRDVFNRDECRGPIAWTGDPPGFGYTSGTPWLPFSPEAPERNVAAQAADPDSILSWYRRLLAFRAATPALHEGDQELLGVGDPDVITYLRTAPDGARAFVALNFANREASAAAPAAQAGASWRVGLSTHPRGLGEVLPGDMTLAPNEALIAVER
ncbi:MAG: alpha-amylase family glycosyl hydrolase, partial [Chloroflexota bacterium]